MRIYYNPAFLRRLFFYAIGITIGFILVKKINKSKNSTFDYGPNARTLKSIRNKPYFKYDTKVIAYMTANQIDTSAVNELLHFGDVDFTEKNRGKQKCNTYHILPTENTTQISIDVKRCDSVATVVKLQIVK